MKKPMTLAFLTAIAFQFLVLIGMYLLSEAPLWTGKEVRIKTTPVDPRSLFRGNYARLDYEISTINSEDITGSQFLRNGELVFVNLKQTKNGLYEFASASLVEPNSGMFLKGRLQNKRFEVSGMLRINYGIEAFFAPKEKAIALEKTLRESGIAVLMVSSRGKARLKDIVGQKTTDK